MCQPLFCVSAFSFVAFSSCVCVLRCVRSTLCAFYGGSKNRRTGLGSLYAIVISWKMTLEKQHGNRSRWAAFGPSA